MNASPLVGLPDQTTPELAAGVETTDHPQRSLFGIVRIRIVGIGGQWIAVIADRGGQLNIRRRVENQRAGDRDRGTAIEIGQSEII